MVQEVSYSSFSTLIVEDEGGRRGGSCRGLERRGDKTTKYYANTFGNFRLIIKTLFSLS